MPNFALVAAKVMPELGAQPATRSRQTPPVVTTGPQAAIEITEYGASSPVVELRQIAGSDRRQGRPADVVMARWTERAASA
jgi:hypothetical protein